MEDTGSIGSLVIDEDDPFYIHKGSGGGCHESRESSIVSEDLNFSNASSPPDEYKIRGRVRPKTLSLSGFNRFWKRDHSGTPPPSSSVPAVVGSRTPAVPKIRCHHYASSSLVSTPEQGYLHTDRSLLSTPKPCDNSSSESFDIHHDMDDKEVVRRHKKSAERKSRSRLSLNFPLESAKSPGSPGKSLPKFLRSSFNKLIGNHPPKQLGEALHQHDEEQMRQRASSFHHCPTNNNDGKPDGIEAMISDGKIFVSSPEVVGTIPNTPQTLAYVEETQRRGLPIIPFAYPTYVIVEKLKQANSHANNHRRPPESPIDSRKESKSSCSEDPFEFEPLNNHRTLENLVGLAQQELLMLNDCPMYDLYENEVLLSSSHSSSRTGSVGKRCDYFDRKNSITTVSPLQTPGDSLCGYLDMTASLERPKTEALPISRK